MTGDQTEPQKITEKDDRCSDDPLRHWHHLWLGQSIPQEHWHFHRRLHERYDGLVLRPGVFSKLCRRILTRHRRATLLRVGPDPKTEIWSVWVPNGGDDCLIIVCFHTVLRTPITALPLHSGHLRRHKARRADRQAVQTKEEAAGEEEVRRLNVLLRLGAL